MQAPESTFLLNGSNGGSAMNDYHDVKDIGEKLIDTLRYVSFYRGVNIE